MTDIAVGNALLACLDTTTDSRRGQQVMSQKTSRDELIWLARRKQGELPLVDASQNDLLEAAKGTDLVCRVKGCRWPRDCLLMDAPFDVGDVADICPRTVIRG